MKLNIESKIATSASDALAPYANALYSSLGKRIVVVAELCATERTEIAPDEDKEGAVKLQIKHLEVANTDQEDAVRQVLRALFTQRTSYGKLTEDLEVELSEETIRRCGGEVNAIEAARLHVAVQQWAKYARQATFGANMTATELRRELKAIADGLAATVPSEYDPVAV